MISIFAFPFAAMKKPFLSLAFFFLSFYNQLGLYHYSELQPAIANIGATLGLPAQGTNPNSDHIYSEGEEFRKQIGAAAYIKCSLKSQQNVKVVFDAAIKVVPQPPRRQEVERKKKQ